MGRKGAAASGGPLCSETRRPNGWAEGSEEAAICPVEHVLHLTGVAVGVRPEAEGLVGAGQRRLDVAQHGVDGQNVRALGAGRAATGEIRLCRMPMPRTVTVP